MIGPFADTDAGQAALKLGGIDFALVDINLGRGPSFEIAEILLSDRIPFMFLTGYDESVIPDRFRDVQRLAKPLNAGLLMRRLASFSALPDRH